MNEQDWIRSLNAPMAPIAPGLDVSAWVVEDIRRGAAVPPRPSLALAATLSVFVGLTSVVAAAAYVNAAVFDPITSLAGSWEWVIQ